MNAFFATNRLSAYIDGDLSDAEMAEVEQAIRENPDLRTEYSRMRSTVERLREKGPMRAPEGFSERLASRLALEKMPRKRLSWLPGPLREIPLEALGLAFAALLVVFLIQRDPSPDVPAEVVAQEANQDTKLEKAEEESPAPEGDSEANPALATSKSEESVEDEPAKDPVPNLQKKEGSRTQSEQAPPAAPPQKGVVQSKEALPEGAQEELDWEERYAQAGRLPEVDAPAATVTLGPVRYRLYPKSPEVLWEIKKLAKRYGARLMTSDGKLAKPFSMTTEENYANLKLQMSPARLEAFVAALKALGAMTLVEQEESKLYSGGMMELELEVQFEP